MIVLMARSAASRCARGRAREWMTVTLSSDIQTCDFGVHSRAEHSASSDATRIMTARQVPRAMEGLSVRGLSGLRARLSRPPIFIEAHLCYPKLGLAAGKPVGVVGVINAVACNQYVAMSRGSKRSAIARDY